MQFIVIEWEVYSLTKDPLSLGLIGLMEIIPAFTMALVCRSYCGPKRKTKFVGNCIAAFSLISFGLFLLTWAKICQDGQQNPSCIPFMLWCFLEDFYDPFLDRLFFHLLALDCSEKSICQCRHLEQFYMANGIGFWASVCGIFH